LEFDDLIFDEMIFPKKYTNEIVGEIGNTVNIRSNLCCMEDINN